MAACGSSICGAPRAPIKVARQHATVPAAVVKLQRLRRAVSDQTPSSCTAAVKGGQRQWRRRAVTGAAVATPGEGSSVCVLGAGVVGLTAALRIKQALPGADVTVVAELFGADTTSDGAGGLWKPYTLGDTPPQLVNRWGQETFDHYMQLYQSPEAPAAGQQCARAFLHIPLHSSPAGAALCLPARLPLHPCRPGLLPALPPSHLQAPSSPLPTSCSSGSCQTRSGRLLCPTSATSVTRSGLPTTQRVPTPTAGSTQPLSREAGRQGDVCGAGLRGGGQICRVQFCHQPTATTRSMEILTALFALLYWAPNCLLPFLPLALQGGAALHGLANGAAGCGGGAHAAAPGGDGGGAGRL